MHPSHWEYMILLVNLPLMTWEGAYFSIYEAVLALYISGSEPEKRAVSGRSPLPITQAIDITSPKGTLFS